MKNNIVYKNKWFSIKKNKNYFVIDENHDQVAILPIVDKNKLLLVKQYRAPLKKYTLEFPAGGFSNKNEKPKIAALRELSEETGIKIFNISRVYKLKKMSVNPQRQTKLPYIFYVNIAKKEYLNRSKKISKEIKKVILIDFKKFLNLYKKGLIISSFMGNLFFYYLLSKNKIKLVNIFK